MVHLPVQKKLWAAVLIFVFRRPWYVGLAFGLAMAVFYFSIVLKIKSQLAFLLGNVYYTPAERLVFLLRYPFQAMLLNFTAIEIVLISTIGILFGMQIALLVYYFKQRAGLYAGAGLSLTGLMSGLIGVGCTACGSVLLSSFFSISTTSAWLGFLPLRGVEFSLLSILLLGLAVYLLCKKLANPLICQKP